MGAGADCCAAFDWSNWGMLKARADNLHFVSNLVNLRRLSCRGTHIQGTVSHMPFRLTLLILGACLGLAACVADLPNSASGANPARIIVKFRQPVDAVQPDFVAGLARDVGIPLRYVRPMSGGAHVYVLSENTRPERLAQVVARLSAREDVEYAVEDRMVRHQ